MSAFSTRAWAKSSAFCLAVFLSSCASTSPNLGEGTNPDMSATEAQTVELNEAVSASEAAGTETIAAADADDLICKLRPQENSRFKRRICLTRAQWKLAAEKARRDTAYTQQRAFSTGW